MKITFTIIFTIALSTVFAQQDMFWNSYSNFNPAMSGFQYQQHGALIYSDYFQHDRPQNIQANYNMRLGQKHGIGINYSRTSDLLNSSNIIANYNYQFDLKQAGRLSTGIGAGINTLVANPNRDSYHSNTYANPQFDFQLNLGVAYKWKGLLTGMSVQLQPQALTQESFWNTSELIFSAHTGYEFSLGDRFQLTPRAILMPLSGSKPFNTDLTLTFNKKFSLGVMYNLADRIGVHAGWDIKEKYRISYSYSTRSTDNIYYLNDRHQITLGFNLK